MANFATNFIKQYIQYNNYIMNSTLQELTDKIYNEGVVKGQNEASEVLNKANEKAAQIIAKAEAKAQQTIEEAEKQVVILRKNVEGEIKLFAGQATNALKTTITDMICDTIVKEAVVAATSDKAFMQGMIVKMVEAWIANGDVRIEASDKEALTSYFTENAKQLLDKGIAIHEVKGLKTSFTIAPENSTYKITIGEAEFVEYFKEFIRPQLRELLF